MSLSFLHPYNVYTGSAITASSVYTFLRGWYYSWRVRCIASHGTSPCRLLTRCMSFVWLVCPPEPVAISRFAVTKRSAGILCFPSSPISTVRQAPSRWALPGARLILSSAEMLLWCLFLVWSFSGRPPRLPTARIFVRAPRALLAVRNARVCGLWRRRPGRDLWQTWIRRPSGHAQQACGRRVDAPFSLVVPP